MKKTIIHVIVLMLITPVSVHAEPVLSRVLNVIYGVGNWEPYNAPDELWKYLYEQEEAEALAQVKFAGANQDFGFISGATGVSFQSLFNVTDSKYLSGSPSTTLTEAQTGSIFRFADDPTRHPLWSSQEIDNSDCMDHMQTFAIISGRSAGNYVVAWEDISGLGDSDYQDLVVEVSGVEPVPEPSTILLLGLGCFVLKRK